MTDLKELKVWRKAHEMTLDIYRVTARFPKQELYGLRSQIEYHVLSACDLHLLEEEEYRQLTHQADELQRMLAGLIRSVRQKERPGAS